MLPEQDVLPGVVPRPPPRLPFYSSVALSSQRRGWGTPFELFDARCRYVAGLPPGVSDAPLPRPWVDPCAVATNALLPRFFSPEEDGLAQPWCQPADVAPGPGIIPGYIFCNPVYGDPEEACAPRGCKKKRCVERGFHLEERLPGIGDWTEKMQQEALEHGLTVDGLVPHRGAAWWARMLQPGGAAGAFQGGIALPGPLAPFHAYWACIEWRLYRWRWLEVEVAVLDGRLKFRPEPGAVKATTGELQTGKDPAGFDSAIVTFRGLGQRGSR